MANQPDDQVELETQDSDYDGAWKEALRLYLEQIMQIFFPKVCEVIDWSVPLKWFDKELSQICGSPNARNRRVDLAVQVTLLTGDVHVIVLHLEVQSSYEADFAERISLYNCGLRWLFKKPVMTLVILGDLRRNWRPHKDEFKLAGYHSLQEFPTCKLIDRLDSEWKDNHSLPVLLARAQIEALRTSGDSEARFESKLNLVRELYEHGYTADEVRNWFKLIDWMMHLSRNFEERFELNVQEIEEEKQMPYVTSIERLAIERAETGARKQAMAEFALAILKDRLGEISPQTQAALMNLSVEQLEKLLSLPDILDQIRHPPVDVET